MGEIYTAGNSGTLKTKLDNEHPGWDKDKKLSRAYAAALQQKKLKKTKKVQKK